MRRLIVLPAVLAAAALVGCDRKGSFALPGDTGVSVTFQPVVLPFSLTLNDKGEVSIQGSGPKIPVLIGTVQLSLSHEVTTADSNATTATADGIEIQVEDRATGQFRRYQTDAAAEFKIAYDGHGEITRQGRTITTDNILGTVDVLPDTSGGGPADAVWVPPGTIPQGSVAAAPVGSPLTCSFTNQTAQPLFVDPQDSGAERVEPGETVYNAMGSVSWPGEDGWVFVEIPTGHERFGPRQNVAIPLGARIQSPARPGAGGELADGRPSPGIAL